MDELYLDNIDELVADHNKIVTYKWLSHTLGVHVNQAKQMLYDYITRKRKENPSAQVHVTYLVTGKCIQDRYPYHKVAVVKEEKLESAKSKLSVVANVHVYSIQKASLKDSAPLFNTDYDIMKNNLQSCNKFSAIQCPAAVPRSPEEIAQLQRGTSQPTEEVSLSRPPAINGHTSPPKAKAKAAAQQPKGIMGMFSRPASKPQEPPKETKTEPKEAAAPETSSKAAAKPRPMANFFGKASLTVPSPPEVKTPSPPPEPVVKMETESKPQAQPGERRRKRRRVLKSRTFQDEEGCLVTEKVYESESYSDSEEDFAKSRPALAKPSTSTAAKAETKTSKKAPAASKGTKQASIMGFFQKK